MNSSAGPRTAGSPRGKTAIGIFLLFGAVMASLAGATLLWRGTALDRMWTLNPRAYKELAPLGKVVGIPFLMLGVLLAVACVGWFKPCLGMAAGCGYHRNPGFGRPSECIQG